MTEVDATLYPDVVSRGGLGPALSHEAQERGLRPGDIVSKPGAYGYWAATIPVEGRLVAVGVGAVERAFFINVSAGYAAQADGVVTELADVLRVAVDWLSGATFAELNSRFPFMTFTRLAEAFERGNPVPVRWQEVFEERRSGRVRDVLRAAHDHVILKELFPGVAYGTVVRLELDPFNPYTERLLITLTADGFEVGASWSEASQPAATVPEAVEAAAALLRDKA